MKTTIPKLRRTIRKVILEFGPPGIGGNANYERGSDIGRAAPSRPKGYGWNEFITYCQEGDYHNAGKWIKGLAKDSGIEMPRWEQESWFEMASADTDALECQRAWKEYLEMKGA